MDDTISRQATIEHLKKRLIETAINNTGVTARCDSIFEDTAENRIGTWINEVPSAQRWIPCSERLPTKPGRYLITQERHYGLYVTAVYFDGNEFFDEAVAWMPTPEPYKGEP